MYACTVYKLQYIFLIFLPVCPAFIVDIYVSAQWNVQGFINCLYTSGVEVTKLENIAYREIKLPSRAQEI
jgi:hypothetical protein